jgi:ABC-type branched-subunit amino acid transport system ATPase component
MLVLESVSKSFGALTAVNDVSFSLGDTGISGLIGPNGSGKTTLFHLITGFYTLDRGSVSFHGERISGLPPHEISRRGIVRTFQQTRVLPFLSVLENLMAAAPSQAGESILPVFFSPGLVRRQEAENRDRALDVLEALGLAGHAGSPAGDLSYGQQKLLELGRVLMADPRLIVLDEPFAGINPSLIRRLVEILGRIRDRGTGIFLIEHNMPLVTELCGVLFVMDSGSLIFSGPPREAQKNPLVIEAYLGRQTHAAQA